MSHFNYAQKGTFKKLVYDRSSSEPWHFNLSIRIRVPNDLVVVRQEKATGRFYAFNKRTGTRRRIHIHMLSPWIRGQRVETF